MRLFKKFFKVFDVSVSGWWYNNQLYISIVFCGEGKRQKPDRSDAKVLKIVELPMRPLKSPIPSPLPSRKALICNSYIMASCTTESYRQSLIAFIFRSLARLSYCHRSVLDKWYKLTCRLRKLAWRRMGLFPNRWHHFFGDPRKESSWKLPSLSAQFVGCRPLGRTSRSNNSIRCIPSGCDASFIVWLRRTTIILCGLQRRRRRVNGTFRIN